MLILYTKLNSVSAGNYFVDKSDLLDGMEWDKWVLLRQNLLL